MDCGPISVKFIDTNTNAAPDSEIFLDDRLTPNSFNFASLYTKDISKKGGYPIQYTVSHANYASNNISASFTVTIVDPCGSPVALGMNS